MPLRGRIVTRPSRASRCRASRMGVRPISRLVASAYSDRNSPGFSRSVTISSSSCAVGLLGQRLGARRGLARPFGALAACLS